MSRVIIDVREPDEYQAGHAAGAINLPLSALSNGVGKLNDLSPNDELIVYCNSGRRSGLAQRMLEAGGFKNVKNGINQSQVEAQLGN